MRHLKALGSIVFAGAFSASLAGAQDFADVTTTDISGVASDWGASMVDYDRDGDVDLFFAFINAGSSRLFRNDGLPPGADLPNFVDVFVGTAAENTPGMGHNFVDLDDDGDLDYIVNSNGTLRRLYRNDGTGFVDFTPAAFNVTGRAGGIAVADFDGDLDLDMYQTAEFGSNMLYVNGGGLSFANNTPAALQLNADVSEAAAFADIDGNLTPDLVVANFGGAPDALFLTDSTGAFTLVSGQAGAVGVDSTLAVVVTFGDYDNDLDLDLYVTGFNGDTNHLYRNDGDLDSDDIPEFTDVSSDGAAMAPGSHLGALWADFDLDGDLDLFATARNGQSLFRRNDGDENADGVPTFSPFSAPAVDSVTSGEGCAVGDFDNDGDLDLILTQSGSSTPRVFRNDLSNGNHWLHVDLHGTISNTGGMGARVVITAGGGQQMREVSGSTTYAGRGDERLVFGLGTATSVSNIDVTWPSGQTSNVTNVAADQRITITEPGFAPVDPTFAVNQAFSFQIPKRGANPTEMRLHFRRGGDGGAFQTLDMFPFGGGTGFEAGIGQSFATQNGIEYVVEYRANGGSARTYPLKGFAEPAFLPARFSNVVTPNVPAAETYVMFGMPFVPNDGSPRAVLEDELGGADKTKYRAFHFDPLAGSNGTYQEHPSMDPFVPGKGYWLIMKSPKAVGSGGSSHSTVGGTELTIERGWNQIAHPYLFPVAADSVNFDAAPNVETDFQNYDGSAYFTDTELNPFEGYFVFNAAAAAETIVIPGVRSTAAAAAAPTARVADGWRLGVRASQGGFAIRETELGQASAATDAPDRLDRHAPPAAPGALRTYFEHVAQDGTPHELRRDLRATGEGTWDLVVDAPGEAGVRVEFDGVADLPSGNRAVVILEDTMASIDLTAQDFLDLPGGRTHRLQVVVGSSAFVDAVERGELTVPTQVALGLGYPNPLTTFTKIGYALPRATDVTLAVYDVSGRRVRSLVTGTRPAGRHVAEWDSADEAGRRVAPGVYFVRLTADSREESRKVTVLR